MKSKITVGCYIHGTWEITPDNHKRKRGCPLCGREESGSKRTISNLDSINVFNMIHNFKYTYPNVIPSSFKKFNVICPLHGTFSITVDAHKKGQGCALCARSFKTWGKTSWKNKAETSTQFDSYKVYIIYCYNDVESFIKIGRTFRTVEERFKSFPYNYLIIDTICFDNATDCFNKEVNLHQQYYNYSYKPLIYFSGNTECYEIEILKLKHK